MIARPGVVEVREQLRELLRKVVGSGLTAIALERERGQRIGARGAPDPEESIRFGWSALSTLKTSATLSGL